MDFVLVSVEFCFQNRTSEEQEWTATELKNSLRSIEWDLEDLEDTIQVNAL